MDDLQFEAKLAFEGPSLSPVESFLKSKTGHKQVKPTSSIGLGFFNPTFRLLRFAREGVIIE